MRSFVLEDTQLHFRLNAILKRFNGRFRIVVASNQIISRKTPMHIWFDAKSWSEAEHYTRNVLCVIKAITRVASVYDADLPADLADLETEIPGCIREMSKQETPQLKPFAYNSLPARYQRTNSLL